MQVPEPLIRGDETVGTIHVPVDLCSRRKRSSRVQKLVLAGIAAMAILSSACEKAPPPAVKTQAGPTSPNVAPPVPATPSDAPKASMVTPGAKEAGSAIGGTAGGNTTDPRPPGAGGGPAETRAAPEPTGGNGSPKAAEAEKAGKSETRAP